MTALWFVVCTGTLLPAAHAATRHASQSVADKLKLPPYQVEFGFGYSFNNGIDGILFEIEGDSDAAIQVLRTKLKERPDDWAAAMALARRLELLRKNDAARGVYQDMRLEFERNPRTRDYAAAAAYGWALVRLNEDDLGQKVLEGLTEQHPDAWQGWLAQGDYWAGKALKEAFVVAGMARDSSDATDKSQVGELVRKVRDLQANARRTYDKAAEVAGNEVDVRVQRAGYALMSRIIDGQMTDVLGEGGMAPSGLTGALPPECLHELEIALASRPNDPVLLTAVTLLRGMEVAMAWMGGGADVPASKTETLNRGLVRLAELEEGIPQPMLARMIEVRSMVTLIVDQDGLRALALARRAVEMDPTVAYAWRILLLHAVSKEDWAAVQEVCEKRLAHGGTAEWRLIHAKAMSLRGLADPARRVIEEVGLEYPADWRPHAGLAVLKLREPEPDAARLLEIKEHLDAIGRAWESGSREGVDHEALVYVQATITVYALATGNESFLATERAKLSEFVAIYNETGRDLPEGLTEILQMLEPATTSE